MSLHLMTTTEKLVEIERLIVEEKRMGRRSDALAAVAADLRSRLDGQASIALYDLDRRVVAVERSRSNTGYDKHALHLLGEGAAKHWDTIKQALERFGAEVEA